MATTKTILAVAILATLGLNVSGICTAILGQDCRTQCPGAVANAACGAGKGFCKLQSTGQLICSRCGRHPYRCCPGQALLSKCGKPPHEGYCKADKPGQLPICTHCGIMMGNDCCPSTFSQKCYSDIQTGQKLTCQLMNGRHMCM